MEGCIPGRELDIQSSLVRIEARVLNGQDPGIFTRLVVVRMPPARWRHEHTTTFPLGTFGINENAFIDVKNRSTKTTAEVTVSDRCS